MNIKYITCSDPREFNDIHDIVALGKLSPRVEIAVQAHPSKMSTLMPRNEWFHELLCYIVSDNHNINLAVHVNREWCDEICRTGNVPQDLQEFFFVHKRAGYQPLVKRWQLNIPRDTAQGLDCANLANFLRKHEDKNFIVQYNETTRFVVDQLYGRVPFSPLFDASGGRGLSPDAWRAPVFDSGAQGYSGGMSPENVADNLTKISAVVPANRDIWIDAEGKLKTDDRFDVTRARQYILNAENWITQNSKQR